MLGRVISIGAVLGAATATGFSLRNNDNDLNTLGIVRLVRSAATVYDIMQLYKRELIELNLEKNTAEYALQKQYVHKIAAEKLLNLMCTNKGVYIKLGQHIASLDYLLPKEFVHTMRVLHKDAPQNSVEDLYKVIRQDLKCEPSEIFEDFETEPLGTASLAQVHKARLRETGEFVAVKVQHPYVRGNSFIDLKTMEVLVAIMSVIFPDMKIKWLVEESKRNLPMELDFKNEAKNCEKIRQQFKRFSWLKIPKIYHRLSTPRVLVMEYIDGGQITDLEYMKANDINPIKVSNKIGELYSEMIFSNGFVHSDPHPGNILVRKNDTGDTEIALLDHGLYADLTDKFRYNYAKFWLSILNIDRDGMIQHSRSLGVKRNGLYGLLACMVTGRAWTTILKGVNTVQYTGEERSHIQKNIEYNYIMYVLEEVDRQMLLIFKTNDLIRSIEHTLRTQDRMAAFWVMSKFCIHSKFSELKEVSKTRLTHMKLNFLENWEILKLNIFYIVLGIKNIGFVEAMKQLF